MNAAGRLVEVRVPNLGNFKDVAVIDVLVKPGDSIAIDTPLFLNMARSFCMSPMVATASVEMARRLAIACTKVPLSRPGGVTSR